MLAESVERQSRQIFQNIEILFDSVLEEVVAFRDLKLTRLELILAQLRHIFFHIGYLHCCLKIERGSTPDYVGIYRAVPEK